ncbi:unnamed protein product [Gongylonema pulchrum]|uniref:SSD domain-containing protein n=2 Tax=Gongylonema pulchrum TaxID=637853 RepID=A0A183DWD5_9BILA|nr:unnamed protein product [Gongylonema pulchrum]
MNTVDDSKPFLDDEKLVDFCWREAFVLDKWLVGKKSSDSACYSEKWRQQFSMRPTWCDADMALQQIVRGVATGNRMALYARSFFQSLLFTLGSFVQNWAWSVVVLGLAAYLICSFGLQYVHIETDLMKLWVSRIVGQIIGKGGRLDEELHFLSRVQHDVQYALARSKRLTNGTNTSSSNEASVAIQPMNDLRDDEVETPRENAFGNGFQEYLVSFFFSRNWTLSDICFKPPSPQLPQGPLTSLLTKLLERLIPCIWITPIDCFWEGSKPLGPSPPLNFGPDAQAFISSLPKGNITWRNLDPSAVLKEVGTLFDLGTIFNIFERAGIGSAYLDRWCIDPLDPECPVTAPNGFDRCAALKKFQSWNLSMPENERIKLEAEDVPLTEHGIQDATAQIIENIFGKRQKKFLYSKEKNVDEVMCNRYGKGLLKWMKNNENRWSEFLTEVYFCTCLFADENSQDSKLKFLSFLITP